MDEEVSAGAQGHITTQNPALLASLRENTMEQQQLGPVHKVYVDSPSFTREEEEKYRYVSSDVEEEEDGGDTMRQAAASPAVRPYSNHHQDHQSVNHASAERRGPQSSPPTSDMRHISAPQQHGYESGRYEDLGSGDNHYDNRDDDNRYGNPDDGHQGDYNSKPSHQFLLRGPSQDDRLNDRNAERDDEYALEAVHSRDSLDVGRYEHMPEDMPDQRMIKPVESPFQGGMSREEEEDLQQLQQENRYQAHLKQKIDDTERQSEQLTIPPLQLERLEEEEVHVRPDLAEAMMRDSLEDTYRDPEPDINDDHQGMVQDSLEFHPQMAPHDSAPSDPETGMSNYKQPRHGYAHLVEDPPPHHQAPPPHHQTQPPAPEAPLQQFFHQQHYDYQQPAQQQQQQQQQQYYEQQQQYREQQQHYEQQQQQQQQQQYYEQQQQHYEQQQPVYVQQYQQQPGHNDYYGDPVNADNSYEQEYQHRMAQVQGQMGAPQPQQPLQEQGYYDNHNGYPDSSDYSQASVTQSAGVNNNDDPMLSTLTSPTRKVVYVSPRHLKTPPNYLELNKDTKKEKQPKSTYGKLHQTRKANKENVPNPVVVQLKDKVIPGKRSAAEPVPVAPPSGQTDSDMSVSAEQLWEKKAIFLAGKKDPNPAARTGSKTRGQPQRGVLRKYGSEGNMAALPAGGQPQQHRPHRINPIAPTRAMAEPIRADVVPGYGGGPVSPGGSPLRHTLVTEDGQRVSVDINLKLMSPQPQQPLHSYRHPQQVAAPSPRIQGPQPMRGVHPRGPPPPQGGATMPPRQPVYAFASPPQQPSPQAYQQQFEPYVTPREMPAPTWSPHQNQPPTPTSPYKVLPPIGSADTEQGRPADPASTQPKRQHNSAPTELGGPPRLVEGGYMDQFRKQKVRPEKPQYKEYTLQDYRKMKKEVRLGSLGPETDSETLREKRDKVFKQQEYAKAISEKNRQEYARAAAKPRHQKAPEEVEELEEHDGVSKRELAMEYARRVPKPRANSHPTSSAKPGTGGTTDPDVEFIDLKRLQERHDRERDQVALIKQNITPV